jgi:hypothetical protein
VAQATTSEHWTAWYRHDGRQPWQQIGTADSAAEAWRVALAYELSGDKTIAAPGRDPNPPDAGKVKGEQQQKTLFE